MNQDTREIKKISFGIYSPEEVIKMSVCKIDNVKKHGYGSVYDPRMGTTESSIICETCNENATLCTGHFGRIELNIPVVHPLYYKRVVSYLNCFCFKCNRLILTRDQIFLYEFNKFGGETRFVRIQEKIKKVDICCHDNCGAEKVNYKFSPLESNIYKIYEDSEKQKTSILMTTREIKSLFDNISSEDVILMGFDPTLTHPRNFIISILPVLPPCDRPYVKADGHICDDDLTNQICEIIKANNHLDSESQSELSEAKYQKHLASLKFRILTTFNNSQGKAKHTTNGRAIKGIKERLTGKDGQIRGCLLGKRCNQSARTVISPEPTLRLGQLAVPRLMAAKLTVPVRVNMHNKKQLQKLVNSGQVDSLIKPNGETRINLERFRRGTRLMIGDVIWRPLESPPSPQANNDEGGDLIRGGPENWDEEEEEDGGDPPPTQFRQIPVLTALELILPGDRIWRKDKFLPRVIPSNRKYLIDLGWIIERKLQDGDYVLLNRQPTLHKGSMMAMEVVVREHKTLRFNLAATASYNADFDIDADF